MNPWRHNRESVFDLTDAERRAIALKASGATASQLFDLGLAHAYYAGREKLAIAERERKAPYKPAAGTTLAKARRTLRPITDVRIGKWKSGE